VSQSKPCTVPLVVDLTVVVSGLSNLTVALDEVSAIVFVVDFRSLSRSSSGSLGLIHYQGINKHHPGDSLTWLRWAEF